MYNIAVKYIYRYYYMLHIWYGDLYHQNREKYAHPSYVNPVRKALTEAGLKKLPYHLDGGTILDKLCPDKPKAILQEKPLANGKYHTP